MSKTGGRSSHTADELPRVAWQISSRSPNHGGNCVEAGPLSDGSGRVAVRHSHQPAGRVVVYGTDRWEAFVGRIKRGDFDPPA